MENPPIPVTQQNPHSTLKKAIVLMIIALFIGVTLTFLIIKNLNKVIPTPAPTSLIPTVTPIPTSSPPTPTLSSSSIPAPSVYQPDQLSESSLALLSHFAWPKLKPFQAGDSTREVYLVNCEVTNDELGIKLTGIPTTVPNVKNIAEITLKELVTSHYGGFPDPQEIATYEQVSGGTFKHTDSGINSVRLDPDGILTINFYDSVRAYGGGSTRVGCMGAATRYTALQFPTIKDINMCIDKLPKNPDVDCAMDFQP